MVVHQLLRAAVGLCLPVLFGTGTGAGAGTGTGTTTSAIAVMAAIAELLFPLPAPPPLCPHSAASTAAFPAAGLLLVGSYAGL